MIRNGGARKFKNRLWAIGLAFVYSVFFFASCVTHGIVHHAKAAKTMGEILSESANQIQARAKTEVEQVIKQQETPPEEIHLKAKQVLKVWENIAELQRLTAKIHADYVDQLLEMVDSDRTDISAKMAWTAKELLRTYIELQQAAESQVHLKLRSPSLELQKVVRDEKK